MDGAIVLEWVLKSVVLLLIMTGGFAYLTFYERKALARLQVRIGPNRAGPGGWLQPIADGIKLIFKEELIPAQADKLIFLVAPIITTVPAWIILGVLPFGPTVNLFGRQVDLSVAGNLNVGLLYITAITSISVYGIVLAGWSSNNKYATMGGIRSSAQMISYELALGLAFVTPIMLAGSMRVSEIIRVQVENGFLGWLGYLAAQPLAPIIFMVASLAEVNRSPFDMPEAEQELASGYHVEYSGMKFALFFMAEYVKMIAVSMIGATLFFGGYYGPFVEQLPILGPFYLLLKVAALLFGMIWIRATLPRIRYDRLMTFGWKIMLPAGLVGVMFTAVVILVFGGK